MCTCAAYRFREKAEGREDTMRAKMLSCDERVRIMDAYERTHNAPLVAEIFGVSEGEVYRLERKKKNGDLALKTGQRGRKPKLNEEQLQQIRELPGRKPDITLKETISVLNLPICISCLSRILEKMGYRLKKKVVHAS